MRKGNLIKLAAPAILSAAMMVSGLPVGVMAADFTEGSAVETSAGICHVIILYSGICSRSSRGRLQICLCWSDMGTVLGI